MFRLLCCSMVVVAFAGCGPGMERCETDNDCADTEYCISRVCLARSVLPGDAGGVDAGSVEAPRDAGQTIDAGVVIDAGTPDAGVEPACELNDTRACCGGRGEQTCVQQNGEPTWDECDATKSSESCNGIDDDCDGTVDDELAWVQPDGGITNSLECSVGVGECASNGVYVCNSSGAPVCGAQVIAPTAEVCDGADNDCDGTTDEGTTITCLTDADNDRYASSTEVEVQLCPDTNRNDWGNCPTGFVAPSASVAVDCDDTSASLFRNVAVRTDADGDSYCLGAELLKCVGGSIPNGFREPSNCEASDDCDDAQSTAYQLRATRSDGDADNYCLVAVSNDCVGATPPTGKKFAETCEATIDCDDNAANVFRVASVSTDGDGDAYCTGAPGDRCIGATPPAGFRLANTCVASSDCNDSDFGVYRTVALSRDGDGDRRCLSGTTPLCIGGAPPQGYRLPTDCVANSDCDDSRANQYRLINMYADADNDGHCTGSAEPKCVGDIASVTGYRAPELCTDFSDCASTDATRWRTVNVRIDQDNDAYCSFAPAAPLCMGTNIPSGYRNPATCNSTIDVIDTNPHATAQSELPGTSSTAIKECGSAPATEPRTISWSCPIGFHAISSGFAYENPSNGVSEALSYPLASGRSGAATSDFRCKFAAIGRDTWIVSVTCKADGL